MLLAGHGRACRDVRERVQLSSAVGRARVLVEATQAHGARLCGLARFPLRAFLQGQTFDEDDLAQDRPTTSRACALPDHTHTARHLRWACFGVYTVQDVRRMCAAFVAQSVE